VLKRLREAETLARRLNDDRRHGSVCALLSTTHALLGELDEGRVTCERALEIAGSLGDLSLRITAMSCREQGDRSFAVARNAAKDLRVSDLSRCGHHTLRAKPPKEHSCRVSSEF